MIGSFDTSQTYIYTQYIYMMMILIFLYASIHNTARLKASKMGFLGYTIDAFRKALVWESLSTS